jgi:signal transduction histidine kinase
MRWIAACGVIIATIFASRIFLISLEQKPLLIIGALLLLSNLLYLFAYKHLTRQLEHFKEKNLRILVLVEILVDLVLLTFILHYSGGVENPFIIYYVFHLMIASIILPRIISYGVASFTMLLVGLMAWGEYFGWFQHYPLDGFITHRFYDNLKYLAGTGVIFISTSYVVVYMTGVVSAQLRHKEEAYRQANIDLLEKDKIKNEYVFRITHDIKGHLAAIKNCLDATLVNLPEEKKEEFVKRAHTRIKKLIVFIKDLLRITQLRLNDSMLTEEFSLSEAVNEVLENHKEKISGKRLSLQLDIEEIDIIADRLSIIEVFDNLLSNSIKYTPEKGIIRIEISHHSQEKIQIILSDTGIGIPKKEISQIFDEFYIASNNKQPGTENSGMGLAIVRKIIRRHNGTIQVKSDIGKGINLSIRLPKVAKPKPI